MYISQENAVSPYTARLKLLILTTKRQTPIGCGQVKRQQRAQIIQWISMRAIRIHRSSDRVKGRVRVETQQMQNKKQRGLVREDLSCVASPPRTRDISYAWSLLLINVARRVHNDRSAESIRITVVNVDNDEAQEQVYSLELLWSSFITLDHLYIKISNLTS